MSKDKPIVNKRNGRHPRSCMHSALLFPFCLLLFWLPTGCSPNDDTIHLKIGHVGHDHHLALFVALDNAAQYSGKTGLSIKTIKEKKHYDLYKNGEKTAHLEIVKVGGGSKMPTALAQGVIDIGLGGVAPVLAAYDKGAPVKLIAPLHSKGDMFVVAPALPVTTWNEFVAYVKQSETPVRIGYKNPVAVAKVIFEQALQHEGLSYGSALGKQGNDVQLVNVKGGGKLNVALSEGLIDGYTGNNPFPAIGSEKNICKIICELEELPPGMFKNHPCCCIAANTEAIKDKKEVVASMLTLLKEGTGTINTDQATAVASAMRWIGTSRKVEEMSIPTSGYSMEPSEAWHKRMDQWYQAMESLQFFQNRLKGLTEQKVGSLAYDFSFLKRTKADE